MYKTAGQNHHRRANTVENKKKKQYFDNRNTVFLGNLPGNIKQDELMNFIESHGFRCRPFIVRKPIDMLRENPKCFAFIRLQNEGLMFKAVKLLNGKELNGHIIQASMARPHK